MKRFILTLLTAVLLMPLSSGLSEETGTLMYIRVGETVLTARLADNSSARALTDLLREGDITIDAHDYGGFEKVGSLPASLPRNDERITTRAGDLILYQGDQFVLYYDTNTWDFTRLGRVENADQEVLKKLLGAGDVKITLSLKAASKPVVYMTTDISSDGLMAIYQALGREATGENVAVKISTGEPGSNHLRVELIGDFVQRVGGTIVECNTAYGGRRASTAMHRQVAADHGYTSIADVDIMDENGSMTLPVEGGKVLAENYVGANLQNYDFLVTLSHFKGHAMAGFGGAIKNLSIGIASAEGKSWIHSGGKRLTGFGGDQTAFLEAMAEAAMSVMDYFGNGDRTLCVNVMNRLSVDCDCDSSPAEPDMHDIGILASLDPVALDQACVDLVYAAEDGGSLIRRIENRKGVHTLEHAAEIGLGSRDYVLEVIDD